MPLSYADKARLPDEILLHVLEHANTLEILKCRQLSKSMRHLIDENVAMQYRISLALCNMEDGPPSSKSSAERLEILHKYQERWSTLSWSMEHLIELENGCWELHGNVFAMKTSEGYLEFHPLSGMLRDPGQHPSWKVNLTFYVEDFTMDPAQDLLVAVGSPEQSESGQITIPVHILSMHTGGLHPDAISPEIILHANGYAVHWNPRVRARGDFFAYLHMARSDENALQVWNWRTGEQYACFSHSQIYSFTFYDDCHVLAGLQSPLTETYEAPPAVEVWVFADDKGQPLDREGASNPCSRLGGLELPRLCEMSAYTRVSFSENSLSARRSFSSVIPPFHVSEDGRLFAIDIEFTDPSDVEYTAVLCIPRHTIQNHISKMMEAVHESKKGLNIPWGSWGPEGCRLFFDENIDSPWTRNPYGSLLVTSRNDNTPTDFKDAPGNVEPAKMAITLRDFSRFATHPLRADQQNVTSTTPSWIQNCPGSWTRYEEPEDVDAPLHEERDSGHISGLFLDNVSTRLPYRCISRTLILPRSYGWFREPSVMLAEDNILVVDIDLITLLSF